MASFLLSGSLTEFQQFVLAVYGEPNDRMYSVSDLLSNMSRFTMRAIKGIRKGDEVRLATNITIALSWYASVANRLHIDIDEILWRRFPNVCSYCANCPCICRELKQDSRTRRDSNVGASKRTNLADYQDMFRKIYPPASRTLADAGIHLAEETGEVSEAIHAFLGEHKPEQFEAILEEMADYASCTFGVVNSAALELAKLLAEQYGDNCHVCHNAPCRCDFSFVARFDS